MYQILLSGGSGTRLWPLSNDLRPKQYLKLLPTEAGNSNSESMVQRVWHQLEKVGINNTSYICASASQKELINSQIGEKVEIIEEPEKRDTFAAIVLSCSYLLDVDKISPDEYVCILPVDSFVDAVFFENLSYLKSCLEKEKAEFALLGVCPTYPSSKYGYIMPEKKRVGCYTVSSFVEKPSESTAAQLIQVGGLWNCGVVCFKLGLLKEKILQFGFPMDYKVLCNNYHLLPKNSFDYQILEKSSHLLVMPYSGMWKDLGTWSTLTEEMSLNAYGNVVMDEKSTHTSVINELDIPCVVSGVEDLVVVVSFDGVLIAEKKNSVNVKQLLCKIEHPAMYEERRWGWMKTLDNTKSKEGLSICKKVLFYKGKNSSYHYHLHRTEDWKIISGRGEIILDGKKLFIKLGDTFHVGIGQKYAIKAVDELELISIETHFNEEQGEPDIRRITFDWDSIIIE